MAKANPKLSRRSYKPDGSRRSAFSQLPFVRRGRGAKNWTNWKITPVSDYGTACNMGRAYAAHFIQYLKDNPGFIGMNLLGHIASDIDFADDSANKGYWVGFFSHLERFIQAGAMLNDVFDDLEKLEKRYEALLAAREREVEEI